jgi:hypothetical protein
LLVNWICNASSARPTTKALWSIGYRKRAKKPSPLSSTQPGCRFAPSRYWTRSRHWTSRFAEVHITNIHRRDALYQTSLVSLAATGVICGFGAFGYEFGVARASPPRGGCTFTLNFRFHHNT